MYSDNSNEALILNSIAMTLSVNRSATTKELVNEALAFSKYSNDTEVMVYLNEVLSELSFKMNAGNFKAFNERINTMLNA